MKQQQRRERLEIRIDPELKTQLYHVARERRKSINDLVIEALELAVKAMERNVYATILAIVNGEDVKTVVGHNITYNIDVDKIVNVIAERVGEIVSNKIYIKRLDMQLYAADIEALRGIARMILHDIGVRGVDLKTAILLRSKELDKIRRRLAKVKDFDEIRRHWNVITMMNDVVAGKIDYKTVVNTLRAYVHEN
ncbi:MAG: hypothetical protein ACP5MH_11415 [Thermoproteus sp.]